MTSFINWNPIYCISKPMCWWETYSSSLKLLYYFSNMWIHHHHLWRVVVSCRCKTFPHPPLQFRAPVTWEVGVACVLAPWQPDTQMKRLPWQCPLPSRCWVALWLQLINPLSVCGGAAWRFLSYFKFQFLTAPDYTTIFKISSGFIVLRNKIAFKLLSYWFKSIECKCM